MPLALEEVAVADPICPGVKRHVRSSVAGKRQGRGREADASNNKLAHVVFELIAMVEVCRI